MRDYAFRLPERPLRLERVSEFWSSWSVMIAGMVRDGLISDEFWAVMEPMLPVRGGRRGRPWRDHREVLEGICWRYRTPTEPCAKFFCVAARFGSTR